MKKILLGGVALVALSVAASAADLPPQPFYKAPAYAPPAYNWAGFYAGVVGGGGWADSDQSNSSGIASGSIDQSGGTVGGTIGYNWQAGNLVFGLEGDGSWAHISGSTTDGCSPRCFTDIDAIGTARGRLGYAWQNWMPYVTAGVAVADIHAGQSGLVSGSDTRVGPTVGAGVEWKFAQNWSAKAEYLYSTFDSNTTYNSVTPVNVSERNVSLFRVGLNFHLY
jgi:outer membrane immunogenic protein